MNSEISQYSPETSIFSTLAIEVSEGPQLRHPQQAPLGRSHTQVFRLERYVLMEPASAALLLPPPNQVFVEQMKWWKSLV